MGIIKAMPFKVSLTKLSVLIAFAISSSLGLAQESHCKKTVYLTFDTGNMSVAQLVADILNRHNVKATFFLANEKTQRGDFALDGKKAPRWMS